MSAPAQWITITSLFDSRRIVTINPFRANPLADDAVQAAPDAYRLALATNGEPPTMFVAGGDVPPFTASGVDPQILLQLPYRVRHAAAATPDPAAVLIMLERDSQDPDAAIPTTAFQDAVGRMRDWLGGKWTNADFRGPNAAQVADAEAHLMDSLFGATNTAQAAQIAAVNANSRPIPRTASEQATARSDQMGRAQR